MRMNRLILTMAVLFAALTMQAQNEALDKVLQKYSENGDINTTVVSKRMLENLPLDQFNVPFLSDIIDRIENMKVLISRGEKAGKALGTKLPGQLSGKGFKTLLSTEKDGSDITVMQSKEDPSSVVILLYKKPQAIAAVLKGEFSDIEDWDLKGME